MVLRLVMGWLSKIAVRLPAIVILATAVASIAIGGFSYFKSAAEVRRQESDKLVALGASRHAALGHYFRSIGEDLDLLASSDQVAAALAEFGALFEALGPRRRTTEEEALRGTFSRDTRAGDRERLESVGTPLTSRYLDIHGRYHAWFEKIQTVRGYYDLFLVTPAGDVVYTAFKEADFATNLLDGKWAQTGLAKAFNGALDKGQAFIDFESYAPSDGAPAAFIARRILRGKRPLGVLVLQMPIGRINEVMQVTAGMGKTGETYIVGRDFLMRSDSRFSDETTILGTRVETEAVKRALAGQRGVTVVADYRGVPVLSAYRPFSFGGIPWALMAEIDITEIEIPVAALRDSIVFIGFGLMLLVACIGVVVATSITRPLGELNRSIKRFRETHQPAELTGFAGTDEIGEIARGFEATSLEVAEYIERINEAREEMRVSEAETRRSQAILQSVLDQSSIAFTLTDRELNYLLVNATYEQWFGRKGVDMVGKRFGSFSHAGNDELFSRAARRIIETGTANDPFEYRDAKPFREPLDLRVYQFPVFDGDGEMVGIGTIQTDITERKRAEEDIAAKEAQLRMAMDNMPGAMWVVDRDLKLVFASSQYADVYGDPGGLVRPGTPISDIIRQEAERGLLVGRGGVEEIVAQRLDSFRIDEEVSFEDRAADGRKIRLTRRPAKDGHIVSVAVDVTELKDAEHEIERRRAVLDSILNNITQGVVMFDKDQGIVSWNPRYPDALNIDEALLKPGVTLRDIVLMLAERGTYGDQDPATMARQRVDSLYKGETRTDISFGDARSFDAQSVRTPDGNLLITYTDITDRKKSEHIIATAMRLINESIQYASRIQRSVLPDADVLSKAFADHVVIWQPKDVVGGDIYLYRKCSAGHLLFLADCTGHGVPGAFMTMIATGALDQALVEIPYGDPAALLYRTNQLVKSVLGQDSDEGESDDGFECGLCLVSDTKREITYVGARFDLWCINGQDLTEIKGDRVGIGYRRTATDYSFTRHALPVADGTRFYLVSDGLVDQIGGHKRRSFGKRRLKKVILDYSRMDMARQGVQILRAFEEYQHDEERRDDISLVGFMPFGV